MNYSVPVIIFQICVNTSLIILKIARINSASINFKYYFIEKKYNFITRYEVLLVYTTTRRHQYNSNCNDT